MKRKPYSPEEAASKIASNNHSYKKHVERGAKSPELREWRKIGVHSVEDYEKHISKVIKSKTTQVFQSIDGKDIYYHSKTNTMVIVKPRKKEGSTCFMPKSCAKGSPFDIQVALERGRRADYRMARAESGFAKKGDKSYKKDHRASIQGRYRLNPVIKHGHSELYRQNKQLNKKLSNIVVNSTRRATLEKQYREHIKLKKEQLKYDALKEKHKAKGNEEVKKAIETKKKELAQAKVKNTDAIKSQVSRQKDEVKKSDEKEKARQEQIKREQLEAERRRQLEEKRRALQAAKERERIMSKDKNI